MRRSDPPRARALSPWLKPWLAPWPWLSLGLLLLCMRTEPPRLWFWLALLLISLVVGLLRALSREH
jgi:hypothetical protein